VEQVEAVIAWQQHDRHISVATDTDAAVKAMVFSMWPFMAMMQYAHFSSKESTRNIQEYCKRCFLCRLLQD
jgi:hypothetical protein